MSQLPSDVERQRPVLLADERAMLESFLNFHRDTLLVKCSGLAEEQLKHPSAEPSNLTLLGLVRHMTDVEYWWFCDNLDGQSDYPRYIAEDDIDACFNEAASADPDEAFERYRVAVDAARTAVADRNLDDTFTHPSGQTASVRWIYLHMIEEYARHNGHADLIRERIDGATGP
ncbi:DinB family protein [Glycomyces sp. L485]|uniref:DinB family protein n=1 Tax=Glycomyces sp. L485 TaxID=2909235 RepID=UPI001F4A132E|nr:DinB family protein [Glycomyces sp. L485]MCH7229271.1 DinB family protein [Glycomyces sp. L485]